MAGRAQQDPRTDLEAQYPNEAAVPDWIIEWLDRLPAGQLALVICAFFVGITWLGILFVHPLMRRLLHRNEPSNELIIHVAE